ncbi:RNA polymerase, sigma 54 subunit, RpoN/SigL [Malonomonas rubra DSM 5091]|uniref:RNA polymerase, sigma 54 subunit, RpoN/SigL n=1 Tax=Malonomonas rubra DSM 5091 TaxID=1122189 RepID=A0A1M6DY72_MALRU|nr:RNA polymerase factor sigma-54 [Malonomonas rubra]SHI78080.1 RNA polymerase, sigma 54 subunit, RpoN/SigL [Malonomonas rubra DSM 5091]
MALDLRLQVKLSQQLVMTPQLQQAIKLLQLSRVELADVVTEELAENPLLEEGVDPKEERDELSTELEKEPVSDVEVSPEQEVKAENEGMEDIDWQTYLEGYSLNSSSPRDSYEDQEERPSYESLLTKKSSLVDHLMWQLGLSKVGQDERLAAAEIIGNLDDVGYLHASIEELVETSGRSVEVVEQALQRVRMFDPAGVAARNLQDCLLLQLERMELGDSLAAVILRDYISELEGRKYQVIAKSLKTPLDEVLEAAKLISELDPRPGLQYNEEDIHYIVPDIYVKKVGDEYVVTQNDEGLPNLRINSLYRSALTNSDSVDKKANEYIQDKMRSAVWLIKSIHQRQRTIYKVTKSIVKFQRAFFDHGIEHLKPLVLRDVAEDIEMHESTVSRVTTNKYVQTPQGLFELKFFFNSGINTADGDSVASESVKSRIKEIIAGEDQKKPYSDQKIVTLLKEQDINIARRTVTKYREMLGLGSSTERKRLF